MNHTEDNLTKSDMPVRYVVLVGTTVGAFNQRDGIKHQQKMAHDFFFTQDDIIHRYDASPHEEDHFYRINLYKDEWPWFDVNALDLHDVVTSSRRKKYEERCRIQREVELLNRTMGEDIAKAMSEEFAKEIDQQILNDLQKTYQTGKYSIGLGPSPLGSSMIGVPSAAGKVTGSYFNLDLASTKQSRPSYNKLSPE